MYSTGETNQKQNENYQTSNNCDKSKNYAPDQIGQWASGFVAHKSDKLIN